MSGCAGCFRSADVALCHRSAKRRAAYRKYLPILGINARQARPSDSSPPIYHLPKVPIPGIRFRWNSSCCLTPQWRWRTSRPSLTRRAIMNSSATGMKRLQAGSCKKNGMDIRVAVYHYAGRQMERLCDATSNPHALLDPIPPGKGELALLPGREIIKGSSLSGGISVASRPLPDGSRPMATRLLSPSKRTDEVDSRRQR